MLFLEKTLRYICMISFLKILFFFQNFGSFHPFVIDRPEKKVFNVLDFLQWRHWKEVETRLFTLFNQTKLSCKPTLLIRLILTLCNQLARDFIQCQVLSLFKPKVDYCEQVHFWSEPLYDII